MSLPKPAQLFSYKMDLALVICYPNWYAGIGYKLESMLPEGADLSDCIFEALSWLILARWF